MGGGLKPWTTLDRHDSVPGMRAVRIFAFLGGLVMLVGWRLERECAAAAGEPRQALEERARAADAEDAAKALYALGEMDDSAESYARALEEYRASVARLASHRFAARATARAEALASHAEGDFVP